MELSRTNVTLETLEDYAKDCTKVFRPGDIVVLVGDIGAGKTTFVSAFCKALGIEDQVVSPTFSIVANYEGNGNKVIHIDTYRLEHVNELYDLGFETLFADDSITMIEWGDRIENLLGREHYRLTFNDDNLDSRDIICEKIR